MFDSARKWRLEGEEYAATDEALAPFIGKKIDLLYEMPLIEDSIPAVYFLFWHVELVYVGASSQVVGRLNDYYREKRHARPMGCWTKIGVMPVPDEIKFTIEDHYINRFQPWFNLNRQKRRR